MVPCRVHNTSFLCYIMHSEKLWKIKWSFNVTKLICQGRSNQNKNKTRSFNDDYDWCDRVRHISGCMVKWVIKGDSEAALLQPGPVKSNLKMNSIVLIMHISKKWAKITFLFQTTFHYVSKMTWKNILKYAVQGI